MKKDLCIEFDLKALPSFLFHLKWPIFTYYKNDNASRLRRSYKNNFQTRHSRPILIPHSSFMASPLVTHWESKWAFVNRWEKNPVPFLQHKSIKTVLLNLLDRHVQNLVSQLPIAMCLYHPNQNQSFD